MYVQGVSTRKVKTITEELCGHEFSASSVSRVTVKLDEELKRFYGRRIEEEMPFVILDARYEIVLCISESSPMVDLRYQATSFEN